MECARSYPTRSTSPVPSFKPICVDMAVNFTVLNLFQNSPTPQPSSLGEAARNALSHLRRDIRLLHNSKRHYVYGLAANKMRQQRLKRLTRKLVQRGAFTFPNCTIRTCLPGPGSGLLWTKLISRVERFQFLTLRDASGDINIQFLAVNVSALSDPALSLSLSAASTSAFIVLVYQMSSFVKHPVFGFDCKPDSSMCIERPPPRTINRRIDAINDQFLVSPSSLSASTSAAAAADPYPFDLVFTIVFAAIQINANSSISDYILLRNQFRLISRDITHFIDNCPDFWTKIVFTARAPLPFVEWCLSRTGSTLITISFRAHKSGSDECYSYGGRPCTFIDYVADAAKCLGNQMRRCSFLTVNADDKGLMGIIFKTIQWTNPQKLRAVDNTFSVRQYSDFRPDRMHRFKFSAGQPFRPFTALSWVGIAALAPAISYHSSDFTARCSIFHPRFQPISSHDFLEIVAASTHLAELTLDGLTFAQSDTSFWSEVLYSIRVLSIAFRGDRTMASGVARLNVPALEHVILVLESRHDLASLYVCGALLCSVPKVTFAGDIWVWIGGVESQNDAEVLKRHHRALHRVAPRGLKNQRACFSRFMRLWPGWNPKKVLGKLLDAAPLYTSPRHAAQLRNSKFSPNLLVWGLGELNRVSVSLGGFERENGAEEINGTAPLLHFTPSRPPGWKQIFVRIMGMWNPVSQKVYEYLSGVWGGGSKAITVPTGRDWYAQYFESGNLKENVRFGVVICERMSCKHLSYKAQREPRWRRVPWRERRVELSVRCVRCGGAACGITF
ncbi:hypothetical protein C8F04DRAFT_1332960 [Mycena alexandri]|uniref:Uncharacterized protein n=1 Tax=Mycena alexandri TaxID=1745969 RepID=A0AAD6RZ92_9AGAR|nr:hypothetical protein C8F04DRAFT_1332960 [Mycena alexandri]